MSYSTDFVACAKIQDVLDDHFGQLTNQLREPSPFLEFIVSRRNTNDLLQRQMSTNGKKKTVELIYKQRRLESDVSDTAELDCEGGPSRGDTSAEYTLPDTGSSIAWTIDPMYLTERCEADDTYLAGEVQANMDTLIRKINTDSLTKAATLFGNFATTGTDTAKVITTKTAAGADDLEAVEDIVYEYREMDYYGAPVIFGGSKEFWSYFNRQGSRCCNTALGLDVDAFMRANPVLPFYERKAESIIGTNGILAMAPGALQLLYWHKFRGALLRNIDTPTHKYGIITDRVTGLEFDYFAQLDCGVWKFQLSLYHDVVGMPADMFAAGDRLEGVTWVNEFVITNP